MKIRTRLLCTILPIIILLHLSTSLISVVFSTRIIEKQAQESAQLLSHSVSTQLNSRLMQYRNISQDLATSVISAIHIETTLKSFRKRYPQFSHIFFATPGRNNVYMTPYRKELIGYPIRSFAAYQAAVKTKRPTISLAGEYLGKKSVVFFAPVISEFVANQEPTVEGIVALVLPLKSVFEEITYVSDNSSGKLFVIDSQGRFLFHEDQKLLLTRDPHVISTHPIIGKTYTAMINQKNGFATYSHNNIKNYIAFSPIANGRWSLGIYGTYGQITKEISKVSHINIGVTLLVVLLGSMLLYLVIRSVVHPIEQLTSFAQKIAHGDKTAVTNIQSSSEIGVLSVSMNSMVQELRGHHEKLEQTVQERTIALTNSNIELHRTVQELDEANTTLQHTRNNLEILVDERTEQLKKALEYIDNIIDSMPSALIGIDQECCITQWNTEAVKITGCSTAEALGEPLEKVVPEFGDLVEKIRLAIQHKEEYIENRRERELNNTIHYETITVYPLFSGDRTDGAVIRIDDITDRVKIEESLQQSQKMDAIGQLAGGVAHDFNNMLSGILGAAQLLKISNSGLDEKDLKCLDLIIKSVTRAAELTAKLLAFGRKGENLFSPLDIHTIIDDVQAIFSRTFDKKIDLAIDKQAQCRTVIGDGSALQSAIMNIGINASHAMPDGGTLIITTQNMHLDSTYCEASSFDIEPGEYVVIEIRDTGSGISQKDLLRIFEPFFTTKEKSKGTGLGLAAVYGTIQDHHGAVTVYSEKKVGTVFHLYLPCSDLAARDHRKKAIIAHGSGTILLVDDEEIIRTTGKSLLKNMGYDVLTARNGSEGVACFRDNHGNIDAVIMDMIMPEMDGHEAFFELRKIDPDCKIIISSGFARNESLQALQQAGLNGFIRKPFQDYELSHILADILTSVKTR